MVPTHRHSQQWNCRPEMLLDECHHETLCWRNHPWCKAMMFFFGLAFELFVEVWYCLYCVFTKPTMTRIFIQHVTRGRTGKKLSPIVENTLNNVLTLSLRKAANPAVVTIGQFRIALMGTTTKSVLLYSGAEVMMWSIKIIISCQEGILVPFEKPGSL